MTWIRRHFRILHCLAVLAMIANIGVALSCCMAADSPASMVQAAVPLMDHDTAFHHAAHTQSDQQDQHECDCMVACTGMAPALTVVDMVVDAPIRLSGLDLDTGEDLVIDLQSQRTFSARAPPSWT